MTTSKLVEISNDSGVTYYTFPGGSGEYNDTAEQLDDTVFGQTYQSNQPGMITWTVGANALFKGFAGYVAKILHPGTPTSMTAEAMTLVSGKTYQIDDTAKRVWDRSNIVIDDNASPVADADIESLDYLFGQVTFAASYTPTTPVTVDGDYFPMTQLARANSFTLTQTVNPIDTSDFVNAQLLSNIGYRNFDPGLRTVSLELGGFYADASTFKTDIRNRSEVIIEINPDGSALSLARGFFKPVTRGQSGDVGALEEETMSYSLNVPVDTPTITPVFNWTHDASTTLHMSIQLALTAFLTEAKYDVRYLPDGLPTTNGGFEGTAVLTDISLSSGLDVMNEFSVSFQGDGAPTILT